MVRIRPNPYRYSSDLFHNGVYITYLSMEANTKLTGGRRFYVDVSKTASPCAGD